VKKPLYPLKPSHSLPRGSLQTGGVDPAGVIALIHELESPEIEIHSLMIVRGGSVVYESWWKPFTQDAPHLLYSLTKSFTSSAVGFAISEGLFSLDDRVIDHFPDLLPERVEENLDKVLVRHLLSMSVGHRDEPRLDPGASDWQTAARLFLRHPVPFKPGDHFLYNTAATNMLSILIQKISGRPLDEYIGPRLIEPLGITDAYWSKGLDWVWGGSGLHAKTESIAKLGLLYLNRGTWNGRQLLPVGWAEQATAAQVSNGDDPDSDWSQGYGFQFWRSRHGFRGDGAFGQFCIVLPEWDAVVAMTSGESDMQKMLDAVWNCLIPAFDRPLSQYAELETLSTSLGVWPSELKDFDRLDDIRLGNVEEGFQLTLQGDRVHFEFGVMLELELGKWKDFHYQFGRDQVFPASAISNWISSTEFVLKIVNLSTPQSQIFRVKITDLDSECDFIEKGVFDPAPPKKFLALRR
jgi:CubicO group peptidase (beta-lactamase class C family)